MLDLGSWTWSGRVRPARIVSKRSGGSLSALAAGVDVFDIEIAEKEKIPHTLAAAPRYTSTDADAIFLSRAGVATAVLSVPNRYMHSPNEVVSLDDVAAAARLIAAFCQSVLDSDNWVP